MRVHVISSDYKKALKGYLALNYYLMSLIIALGVIISIGLDPHYYEVNYILIPAFLLTIFGFIYRLTSKKIFGFVAMLGFIFFVPIGLIGIYAIRNMMDDHAKLLFKRTLKNDNRNHR
jgi:uncharacterized membrane protein YuzA (DUF378 family)